MEIKYLSVAEMGSIEREANASGLSYSQMMEHAGVNLANTIHNAYGDLSEKSALGLIGPGNNGGDTLVALTALRDLGWNTCAYILRPRPDDPLTERLTLAGGQIVDRSSDHNLTQLSELLESCSILLDGVLGTGFTLPLRSDFAEILDYVRQYVLRNPDLHVVAVDCPSGVECDSGEAAQQTIPAELTVTMAAAKHGLFKFPAYNLVGKISFVGIGLGEDIPYPESWNRIRRFVVTGEWVKQVLPERPLDAHKGTFGTALVVAGSLNYTGAALLAGRAAYRSGAGLVIMAVPRSLHAILAGHFPEATWLLLPEEMGVVAADVSGVLDQGLERATALLVGPGFGLASPAYGFLARLFDGRKTSRIPPLVVDADALKLIIQLTEWPDRLPPTSILTPHPGEMAVLTGMKKEEIQENRLDVAESYARRWGHIVMLKGAFSVISDPVGRTGVIPVATPALARAGSGDVLAGIAVGLRAQGIPAFEAACAAAWIHGQAGILASQAVGVTPVLAGDILAHVPEVLKELEN